VARRQTPQEKKARDLTSRVDMFGENQKAARRKIPLRKAQTERSYRRGVALELARGEDADTARIRRKAFWRKWPGPTLAEAIEHKLATRQVLAAEPRRSDAVRERRAARRAGRG